MQIPLLPYERHVLEALEIKFKLDRALVVQFAGSLSSLTDLFTLVIHSGEGCFREGRVALAGFINHAHHLLFGGLSALDQGNGHVWSACVRGLMETYGACVIVKESPGMVPNFISGGIKAGKLKGAAERACPGLKNDMDRLSRIVHPSSGAIFAGLRVKNRDERIAVLQYGLQQPDLEAGHEGVVVLANLASKIVARLKHLSSSPDVLNAGGILWKTT